MAIPVLLAAQLATGDDDELDRALESLAVLVPGRYRLAREVVSLARGASVEVRDGGRGLPRSFMGASAAALAAAASTEAVAAHRSARGAATLLAGLDELMFCPGWPASRRRLLGEVYADADDVGGARGELDRATDELDRLGALPELARSHLGLADLALRGDRPASEARGHAREALSLIHRCGSYRWLAQAESLVRRTLRDTVGAPAPTLGPGTRVVMVTDLAGSTALSVDEGDEAYYQQIHDHYGLVRRALTRFGGSEFDSAGDGLYAYFADMASAERCALSIMDETPAVALRVRIGLALGEPLVRDGRVWGSVVNLAARLVGVASPGQIVTNDGATAASAQPSSYRSLGLKTLKGFPVTIGVQELVYQELLQRTPPT